MVQRKYADAIKETQLLHPVLVSRLGEDHHVTLAVLGTQAAAEGYLGMWRETVRDDLELYRMAVRTQGPRSFQSLASLSDASLAECRSGRFTEGEIIARKAYQESSQAFGPRAGITGGSSYSLAACLIGLKQAG